MQQSESPQPRQSRQSRQPRVRRNRRSRRTRSDIDSSTGEDREMRSNYMSGGGSRGNSEDSYLKKAYNNPEIILNSVFEKNVSEEDTSTRVTEDNQLNESKFSKIFGKFDITLDSILEKLNSIVQKLSDLFKDLFKFMKQSIEKKQLKKVFLLLVMSISMAILFVGINVIFGKVIL